MSTPSRTPARTHAAVAARLVIAWTLLCGVVLGVGWLLTHPLSGSVGAADEDLSRWVAGERTDALTPVAEAAMLVGETVPGIVVLLLMALGFSLWKRSVRPGLFVVVVGVGLFGVYVVATALISRDRPPVRILDPGLVPDHSFPSGHVATATGLCGCLVILLWLVARGARPWVLLLLLLPLGTLAARIYQGAHFLSDTVTSLVYASTWVGTVAWAVLREPSGR